MNTPTARLAPSRFFGLTRQVFSVILLLLACICTAHAQFASAPAFPGAEGFGRYVTGGRGGQVIHVTNLNDSGTGSLRAAIQTQGPRIIVFDVSGTIELASDLKIANDDCTILGQTAPGDGICLRNYTLHVNANNVIVRFIRCRMGDTALNENDALSASHKDENTNRGIIIDHCSVSWCVDECGSFYGNEDFTLQWCILSESLNKSIHGKGSHGYGGIWGGNKATFHHNLLAHHGSRNPRFDHDYVSTMKGPIDYVNNAVYNWGGNSTYGGESSDGGFRKINMINNYYKYGPATSNKDRLINVTSTCSNCLNASNSTGTCTPGHFHIDGNYMYGSTSVTSNNWQKASIVMDNGGYTYEQFVAECKSDSRFTAGEERFDYHTVSLQTAEDAFAKMLAYAGACYKRDRVDARIVAEAEEGTFTYAGSNGSKNGMIDTQDDVKGTYASPWPELEDTGALTDTDRDGIPDAWEQAHGLSITENNAATYNLDKRGYYTDLEVYANYLVQKITKAERAGALQTFEEYYPLEDEIEVTPAEDTTPAAVSYTFGIGIADVTVTGSTIGLTGTAPGALTITHASKSTKIGGQTRTVSNGSEVITAAATAAFNNRDASVTVYNSFSDAFYFGFDIEIAEGYTLDISQISGNFFPSDSRNSGYKFQILNGNTLLYESQPKTFKSNVISATEKTVAVKDLDSSVQALLGNLSGTVSVRMLWYQDGSSSYATLKDLNISASVKEASGTRYSLTTYVSPADAGSIATSPTGASFLADTEVTLTATPTEWYTFSHWSDADGATVSTSASMSITMDTAKSYTANFAARPASTISYSTGDSGAEGSVPAAIRYVEGASVTIPSNRTLFASGRTLTGWTDGSRTYAPGSTFSAGATDVELTPVFTPNTASLSELKSPKTAIWQLGRGSGAPDLKLEGNSGLLVTQVKISGATLDLKLGIDATGGKLNNINRTDALAQSNAGTKFYVPVVPGATVSLSISTASSAYTLDGTTINGEPFVVSGNVGTYTYTGSEAATTLEIIIGATAKYSEYISVTYPQTIALTGEGVIVDAKRGFDFVVGIDGNIDEAIAAANAYSGTDRFLIFIPDGTYRLAGNASFTTKNDASGSTWRWDEATGSLSEGSIAASTAYDDNGMTWLRKSNVSIIGQSKEGTILYNIPYIPGISYTSTLEIRSGSKDTYLQDFSLRNLYAGGRHDKGVAVAFYDRGTNTVMKNVSLWSNQDTYVSAATRSYYETCDVAGTVDFICGGDDVWFERCELVINDRAGNVIVAPRTAASATYGYVFNHCTIRAADGATSVQNGNWNLGRPWGNSPAATYLHTRMEVTPATAGWTKMNNGLVLRFHEYGSTDASGNLLDLSKRSLAACVGAEGSDACVLTAAQAEDYTIDNVFNGENPQTLTAQTAAPAVSLVDGNLSWADDDYALCWVIFKDGVYVANVTEPNYRPTGVGHYTVRAANAMGGLGASSNTIEINSAAVAVSSATFATLYLDKTVLIPEGVKAYTGVIEEGNLVLSALTDVIPAHTAVVIAAPAAGYSFETTTETTFVGSNDLRGVLTDTPVASLATSAIYTLAHEDNGVGFYRFQGSIIPANKAYLPTTSHGKPNYRIRFDEEATVTGIRTLQADKKPTRAYDLTGRESTNRGLRVVDGKVIWQK